MRKVGLGVVIFGIIFVIIGIACNWMEYQARTNLPNYTEATQSFPTVSTGLLFLIVGIIAIIIGCILWYVGKSEDT